MNRNEKGKFTSTHGLRKSKSYKAWGNMKQRCFNPNDTEYHRYGGRGITVCDRWMSFEMFFEDMGHKPIGGTLDRIDPDGNYGPDNCRWASWKIQAMNKTNANLITYEGITKNLSEWARVSRIHEQTIRYRISSGWSIEQALGYAEKPARTGRKKRESRA